MTNVIKNIQFKRGTKEDLCSILKDDRKPLCGEPVYEIAPTGFAAKIKIGDGEHDYADLPYVRSDAEESSIVMSGYYDTEYDTFWKETAKINPLPRLFSKFYKDINTDLVYYLTNNNTYTELIMIASPTRYGLSKLYDDLGSNIDGSIMQKVITENLNKKCEITDIDQIDESITFKADIEEN